MSCAFERSVDRNSESVEIRLTSRKGAHRVRVSSKSRLSRCAIPRGPPEVAEVRRAIPRALPSALDLTDEKTSGQTERECW